MERYFSMKYSLFSIKQGLCFGLSNAVKHKTGTGLRYKKPKNSLVKINSILIKFLKIKINAKICGRKQIKSIQKILFRETKNGTYIPQMANK